MSPPGKSACDAQAQLLPFQTATQAIAIYVRSCSGRSPSLLLAHLSLSFPIFSILVVREYWAQFESGSIHHFELRKGGLGFYQLNMAPVYAAMKEFYREHQAQTQQRIGLT